MSRLIELQGELREASAAVAQFEKAFVISPNSPSVAAMLASFQKRRESLEKEFLEEARSLREDLCRYRFFADHEPAPAAVVGTGLVEFQKMFTLAFDAIQHGQPRRSARVTPELSKRTAFIFGYTFSGSVGVVLTFDNSNRTLFGSDLDSAMDALGRLAKARTKEEVVSAGAVLGVPCVNAMYHWASHHLQSGFGADLEWQQGHETKLRLLMQLTDLKVLVDAIESTDQTFDDEETIVGILGAVDMPKRTFEFTTPDGTEIRGKLDDAIPRTQSFSVNVPNKCVIRKRVRVFYSTKEEEPMSHHLVSAEPVMEEPK